MARSAGSTADRATWIAWIGSGRSTRTSSSPADVAFSRIHRGDRIFIGTGCGQPQYLVDAMVEFVKTNPKAFFDAEVIHVWTLGLTPYLRDEVKRNFRLDSFFIGSPTRAAVNQGEADYTAIFLSQVPQLFRRGVVPIDVALIQTSPPDEHGYLSLGVSVDIVRAAVDCAQTVICQVNRSMPRTHGDSFVRLSDIDFILPHDEPLLEYDTTVPDDIADRIGRYVARLVQDGATIQVGYGRIPDAILSPPVGQVASGRPYRAPERRDRRTHEGRCHRQHPQVDRPEQDRGGILHGEPVDVQLPRRQPVGVVPPRRLHQQPRGDLADREDDRDQHRARDRPHRAGDGRVAGE